MKLIKKRLDQVLIDKNLVETKTKAQSMIMAGQVFVEGNKITKSGHNVYENVLITINRLHPEWVSRGALKLLRAIELFNINIENKICLDIGASTGGFTQVLLKYNAKKIYSVDVGKNQLHEKLLKEKKIVNLEKINARYLKDELFNESIDINTFRMRLVHPIYDLAKIAMEITNQESKYCNFDELGYMILHPEYDITKFITGNANIIYGVRDISTNQEFKFAIRSCRLPEGY